MDSPIQFGVFGINILTVLVVFPIQTSTLYASPDSHNSGERTLVVVEHVHVHCSIFALDASLLEKLSRTHNSVTAIQDDGTSQNTRLVENKFHELDKRFRDLSFEAQTEIRQTTELFKFKDKLTSLPLGIRKEHSGFLQLKLNTIVEADSVEEIFIISLSPYWSFLDFNLLDYLVRELGSSELQTKMEEYRNDLTQFQRATTVSQVAGLWPSSIEDPPKACRLNMNLNKNPLDFTLEQVGELRRKFCSVVLLSDLTMIVADLGDGSVRVGLMLSEQLTTKCSPKWCYF